MSYLRLTRKAPGAPLPRRDLDATRRGLFGLHLAGSLLILLAVWPSGWRLGAPAAADPFATWWGTEVVFLGLTALQFSAGRWASGRATGPDGDQPSADDHPLWILLLALSILPTGVAAYRINPVPPAPAPILAASLAAELLFFGNLGRVLRRAVPEEPSLGLTVWAAFLGMAVGVWLPWVRGGEPQAIGLPWPALGPVPYPLLFEQPGLGPWNLPPALPTAAAWTVAAALLGLVGRRWERRPRP